MKKRILSMLLALALLCAFLPSAAAAEGDVAIDETNFPDAIFRYFVKRYDSDHNDVLSQEELAAVTQIDVDDYGITSLKGIEYFYELKELSCRMNQLTELDVSRNKGLTGLYCYMNQLTSLDVSGCPSLEHLACDDNQLTALDVSKNTALIGLGCCDNQLSELDVSKNTALEYLVCYMNQLTALDVSKNTALTVLQCFENQLTTLDVSSNTALIVLSCDSNQLTALDVSRNTALNELRCSENQLTALDVSRNTALIKLVCCDNQLSELDVSKNTALEELFCYSNQLTALDVSKNAELFTLECYNNQLTALDVSKNAELSTLECYNNQLTALDLSKNRNLSTLRCYGNNMTVLNISFVPHLLYALENGAMTVFEEEGFVEYRGRGFLAVDLGQNIISEENPFLDVTTDDFFYDAVIWAVNHDPQITTGTSATSFSPGKTCTRSEVVTFLWRAAGCPEPTITENPFTDVKSTDWFYKAVLWARANSITTGSGANTFSPRRECSRAEVVTFLWRAARQPEPTTTVNPFTDVEDSFYYKAVLWAVENGITTGTSKTTFAPKRVCTRGEVVTFLYCDRA